MRRMHDGKDALRPAQTSDGIPSVEAQHHDNSATRRMRILVAGDNEVNQMVAVEMLRSGGWEAVVGRLVRFSGLMR